MKNKIFIGLVLLLLSINVNSTLGNYVEGDTITYTVVCHTDEGNKDIGCSVADDDILDPDDTTAKSPTVALAEVSDANFPGLWRGSYKVPVSALIGTWSIFIELTNSNSTTGATVLTFQILESDSGFGNISDKLDTIDSNVDLILVDTGTDGVLIASGQTVATCTAVTNAVVLPPATETQIDNIEADTEAVDTASELLTLLTGGNYKLSTQTNLTQGIIVLTSATETQIDEIETDTSAQDTASELRTLLTGGNWVISAQSNLTQGIIVLTSATETQINEIETDTAAMDTSGELRTLLTDGDYAVSTQDNISDILNVTGLPGDYDQSLYSMLSYNQADGNVETDLDGAGGTTPTAVWQYANRNLTTPITESGLNMTGIIADTSGLSTHSAADVWTTGSRELSTPANYKADITSLATSAKIDELNSSLQTFIGNYIDGLNTTMLGNFTDIRSDILTIVGYVDDVTGGGIQTIYDWLVVDANVVQDNEIVTIANLDTYCDTAIDVDTQLNASHSEGNWSAIDGAAACATSTDIDNLNQSLRDTLCWQSNLSQGMVVLTSATETQINNIETDTSAYDTASERRSALFDQDVQLDLDASGHVKLISATETQIDNIESDTSAVDTSDELRTRMTGGDYTVATQDNITDLETHGDSTWATASGFSSHSAVDVDTQLNLSHPGNWSDKADVTNLDEPISGINASVYQYFTDGSNENVFKADVSGLATLTKINELNVSLQSYITSNTSVILARGNSAWITASGFETEAIAALRFANLTDNITVVITRGNSAWITATGFETETTAALRFVNLTNNITAVIVRGDSAWITATGFTTSTNINDLNESLRNYLATQTNLTQGIIVLTSATEGQIDAIELDTDEIQGNQSRFITADISGLETESAASSRYTNITGNQSTLASMISTVEGYVDDVSSGGIKTVYDIVAHTTHGLSALKDLIDNLLSGQVTISTDLNDTEQYKSNATIENQDEILAGMITNTTDIKSKIDDLNDSLRGYVVSESVDSSRYDNLTTYIVSVNNTVKANATDLMTVINTLAKETNLTQGIIILTSATEAQIDAIEADTDEIQSNQTSFVTATGFATLGNMTILYDLVVQNTTGIIDHGKLYWNTSTFSGLTSGQNTTLYNISTHTGYMYEDLVYGGGGVW